MCEICGRDDIREKIMKRVLLCCVLCLILLSGCGRPWGVLSHDEMVEVVLDVHIAEASIRILDSSAKRIERQEYYNVVFDKHHITKEQFDIWSSVPLSSIKANNDSYDNALRLALSLLPKTYGVFSVYVDYTAAITPDMKTWIEILPGQSHSDISILNISDDELANK